MSKKENETIVIYRNGNEVIALDKATRKKGIAKCNPSDEFDFIKGADLAYKRLREELEEKQLYNGYVMCVENVISLSIFKKGKIYKIVDGVFMCDVGFHTFVSKAIPIKSFEDLCNRTSSRWIEVKNPDVIENTAKLIVERSGFITSRKCSNCGYDYVIEPIGKFCRKCGAKFVD